MNRKRPRGQTLELLVSVDAPAAKRFFQKALRSLNHPRPRVINVDGNPSYPKAGKQGERQVRDAKHRASN